MVPGGPEEGLRESDEHEAEHKEATLPLMVATLPLIALE